MRIGVLTSSRADFGIYLPLLKKLSTDDFFELNIIAFGTHLSPFHGKTVSDIEAQGFTVQHTIESMLQTDSSESISTAMGLTTLKFASFWETYGDKFDLVFCLGDRYEMFAALIGAIPFQIPFAHIHGGETTLGAIDNIFRHSISLICKYHFVATEIFAEKVASLIGTHKNIYNVGALSLDNLINLKLLSIEEFKSKWGIDLIKKTILTTFHPETIAPEENELYIQEIIVAINSLADYQVIITMPNADTAGSIIRTFLNNSFHNTNHVFLVENLGSQSYFTAMKYSNFLLGNTSSGIIEAASFNKHVINLGDRQKGRIAGNNVINVPIKSHEILEAVRLIETKKNEVFDNIYYKSAVSDQIISTIKSISS